MADKLRVGLAGAGAISQYHQAGRRCGSARVLPEAAHTDGEVGSKGTLIYDRDRLYMAGSDEPPELFDLAKNYQVCFSSAVREFVQGIRSGNPFPTDRLDNLETLKLMESSYIAAGVKF
jgi:hypothetical protein